MQLDKQANKQLASTMTADAQQIIDKCIKDNLPGKAVENALINYPLGDNVHMIAIGKAAWSMAKAAADFLGDRLSNGIVVTKYGHSGHTDKSGRTGHAGHTHAGHTHAGHTIDHLHNIRIYEAGHPLSDENTIHATQECINMARDLQAGDELLFLISGGGSALFEAPCDGISLEDIQDITSQLLAKGADIVEMNMIRKRLSKVKAGRFAQIAAPAKVFSIVLSDVLGDRLDTIASGPAAPDSSTMEDAFKVVDKYGLRLTEVQQRYLSEETPKAVDNVETVITGSVRTLCESAAATAKELGYNPLVLTTQLNCEAREAGRFLAAIGLHMKEYGNGSVAIIAGGETVVTLRNGGETIGKGGRNQELALSAAREISGLDDVLIFSLGSDGTDGPTDAAGGIVNGKSLAKLKEKGFDIDRLLEDNDSYTGLAAIGGLIMTGPTGTNVNDVSVVLCRNSSQFCPSVSLRSNKNHRKTSC